MQEFPYTEIFAGSLPFLPADVLLSAAISVSPFEITGKLRASRSLSVWGHKMGERRRARRYEVYLPLQVCTPKKRPTEFHTAQLRDISRSGVFYHSATPVDPGSALELTFALPTEKDSGTSVLVRASVRVLRVSEVEKDFVPVYGVAAAIDRIDFVRPMAANVAA